MQLNQFIDWLALKESITMGETLKDKSSDEKIAYLIKPILTVLQKAGGKLTRTEIKNRICEIDDVIDNFSKQVKISKSTKNPYKEFDFKFNFAIKDLSFLNYLTYNNSNNAPILLTDKGLNVDTQKLNVFDEVISPAKEFWKKRAEQNKGKKSSFENGENARIDEATEADEILNQLRIKILNAIDKMSPKKFETFSRALLTEMGVEFTDKGIQISSDGGIDGYGYHKDPHDFRTTRVVIQCKRYNAGSVGVSFIHEFLGAMTRHHADFGVFITNSTFTKQAQDASKEGSPITLIDRNELVELVIKYQLYLTPVTTYVMHEEFYGE